MTLMSDGDGSSDRLSLPVAAVGYGGLAPFLGAAALAWFGVDMLFGYSMVTLMIAYGAVILSFLGGIRWGLALNPLSADLRDRHIVLSVIPPLLGWLALMMQPAAGVVMLIAGFAGQLVWDLSAAKRGIIPEWFKELRVNLTGGALLSLLLVLPLMA